MNLFRRPSPATPDRATRVIYQIASLCLQYPDEAALSRIDLLHDALAEQSDSAATRALIRFVEYLSTLRPHVVASAATRAQDSATRHPQSRIVASAATRAQDSATRHPQSRIVASTATRAQDSATRHPHPAEGGSLVRLQQDYIEVFDLSRHQTLYLTYWSDGDTRRRGSALAAIKQTYRDSGFLVDTHGELPDYLPMVLEFAARVNPETGRQLLIEHRASLELIRIALQEKDSPYADALIAVCATLPGESPADKATALSMRAGPPTVERVGLDSGDPRLLPLFTSKEMSMMTGPNRTGVPR